MSKSKAKGTGGENEIVDMAEARGLDAVRMPAGANYDVRVGASGAGGLDVLATRPDYGRWLATLRLEDLLDLAIAAAKWHGIEPRLNVESKRFKKNLAVHTTWTHKFGG